MTQQISPGDVVTLRSGGPRMLVECIHMTADNPPRADCVWFVGSAEGARAGEVARWSHDWAGPYRSTFMLSLLQSAAPRDTPLSVALSKALRAAVSELRIHNTAANHVTDESLLETWDEIAEDA